MTDVFVEGRRMGRTYHRGKTPIVALASATFLVHAGDRIAVLGPSGGGKSTLLQLMGGLDSPSEGEITWPALGERASLRPRQIGYVFQTQSLLAPLTVRENVELPLLLVGESPETARERAGEVLEQLALTPIAEKLPQELSGGQAQRVAVARAFVGRPRLILADEPTGYLDHPTAYHLFDVLLTTLAGSDTALVVATHDLKIAERLPARWRMTHGRLEVA
jgi:putative ABC transport system ATP-binding protein/lipoprotein-releasing system ATP-binding protein